MAVNIKDKLSNEDLSAVREKKNPPEFEEGFDNFDMGGSFDDLDSFGSDSPGFDNLGESFGSTNLDSFGSSFGSSGFGGGLGNNGFGGFGQPQQQAQPDFMDKLFEMFGDGAIAIGKLIIDLFKSMKNKSANDWGYYSRNLMVASLGVSCVSIIACILGTVANIPFLKINSMPIQFFTASLLSLGTGLITISVSAIRLSAGVEKYEHIEEQDEDEIFSSDAYKRHNHEDDDMQETFGDFEDEEYDNDFKEKSRHSAIDDYFDDDAFKSLDNDDEYGYDLNDEDRDTMFENTTTNEEIDLDKMVEQTNAQPILSRELLFNTFKHYFATNTAGFAEVHEIDSDSNLFLKLETLALKALAAAKNTELQNVESHLISATETFFSFELIMKRVKGLNRIDDIQREMTNYFRESSEDTTVNCSVYLEGDNYRMVINKGNQAIITFGDCFKLPEVEEFYLDRKNQLPCIAGVTELGKPLLIDAKHYDTVLIAGKPRSGKSWYVLSLLMSLMTFNTPEDVQLLIIDPKESNLFKTISYMPHVCGLHNDSEILTILREVIENEAPKRKQILSENKCDDIWALKKKGVKLPVLYIVIDEVMTVIANLQGENDKVFFNDLKVIISQLPSLGIRLIIVPHRSQGVVDKTIRSLIGFSAAVRADSEIVCETLGIKRWNKTLVNQGDTALKLQGKGEECFVKGIAVTTSDTDNVELIEQIAKTFYKMGVDIPDMKNIGKGFNRSEHYIQQQLAMDLNVRKVRYDVKNPILQELPSKLEYNAKSNIIDKKEMLEPKPLFPKLRERNEKSYEEDLDELDDDFNNSEDFDDDFEDDIINNAKDTTDDSEIFNEDVDDTDDDDIIDF